MMPERGGEDRISWPSLPDFRTTNWAAAMPTPTTDPHPVSAPDQGVPGDWLFEHAPLPQTCAVVTPDGALSQWRGNVAWHRLFEGAAPWVDPAVHAEFVHRLIARSGQGA